MYIDTHCHLSVEDYEDIDVVIKENLEAGVNKIIVSGCEEKTIYEAIELSKKYDCVFITIGYHPDQVDNVTDEMLDKLKELLKLPKVVGVGEIGLDYYWNKNNKKLQKQVFIKQIELANKLNLPIVIHTREAVMDTLGILKNTKPATKPGVFHCCPLNIELVREALKLGFYISFAGPVTFKNSKNAKEIVELVPLDKMLIETDSPYLAPEPVRGTRNDSRNVKYIAEKIAEFKGVKVEEIAKNTYENAKKVFDI